MSKAWGNARKCSRSPFVCQGEALEEDNTSHNATTHELETHTHTMHTTPACFLFSLCAARGFPLHQSNPFIQTLWRMTVRWSVSKPSCLWRLHHRINGNYGLEGKKRWRWRRYRGKEIKRVKKQMNNVSACDRGKGKPGSVKAWRTEWSSVGCWHTVILRSTGVLRDNMIHWKWNIKINMGSRPVVWEMAVTPLRNRLPMRIIMHISNCPFFQHCKGSKCMFWDQQAAQTNVGTTAYRPVFL